MSTSPGVDSDLELIAAKLSAVRDVVEQIKEEVGPGTVRGAEALIARRRQEIYAAMEAVGAAVYDFLQSRPSAGRLAAAKALVIEKLREISLTSPIVFFASQGKRSRLSYFELVEHVRTGKAAGADVPARVLDDYYVHTSIGQAFLNRLHLFSRRLIDEVLRCQTAAIRPLHLVSLQHVGGDELLALAKTSGVAPVMQVTSLDQSAVAVRHAEQTLRPAFNTHLTVTMAQPANWLNSPTVPADSACIIYAVSLLEQLPAKRSVRILEGAHRVLHDGGVLLLGCTSGEVPVAERMIRDWLLGWDWDYRTESEWRELFAQTPFGVAGLTFEYEPLGINAIMRVEKTG